MANRQTLDRSLIMSVGDTVSGRGDHLADGLVRCGA